MSLIRCHNCNGVVSMRAPRCPHCLTPVEQTLKNTFTLLPTSEADQHRSEFDFMQEIKLRNDYRVSRTGVLSSYNHELKVLNLPKFVHSIPEGAFDDEHHGEYFTEGHDGFFENNQTLEEVYIPSTIKVIPVRAFQKCINLRRVILGEGVKEIAENAFMCCEKLEEVVLPSSLECIGVYAFGHCVSLKSLTIPSNVHMIYYGAFAYCENLCNVLVKKGEQELHICDEYTYKHRDAFYRCNALNKVELELRPNLLSIASSSLIQRELQELIIADEYKGEGFEVAYNSGHAELTRCQVVNGELISYFRKNRDILHIPDDIRKVTASAFRGWKLSASIVSIGKEVEYIEDEALSTLSNVKEFRVHPMNKYFKAIQGVLFSSDLRTLIQYPYKKEGQTYMVPSSVTKIANNAFRWAVNLRNLYIPDSVVEIGEKALSSNLERNGNIRYPATFQE